MYDPTDHKICGVFAGIPIFGKYLLQLLIRNVILVFPWCRICMLFGYLLVLYVFACMHVKGAKNDFLLVPGGNISACLP